MIREKLKVLFLNPFDIYTSWPVTNDFLRFYMNVPAVTYPQLAAVIKCEDVDILDLFYKRMTLHNYIKLISKGKYDFIGINASTSYASLNTFSNIKLIKKVSPNTKIILGGHHATIYHEEWIKAGIDFIVRNEGENTLKELIMAIKNDTDLKCVDGLSYNDNGNIKVNKGREFINNLDELEIPAWEKANLSLYNLGLRQNGYTASIETSRGCYHHCDFCIESLMWNSTQRYKSIPRVLEEIKKLKSLGTSQIAFVDDNFGGDIDRDFHLCEAMLRENIDVNWWCFLRSDTVVENEEFIKVAAKSGLKFTFIGYEMLTNEELEVCNKELKINGDIYSYYLKCFEILNKNGIFVLGLFVTGYPFFTNKITLNLSKCQKICHEVSPSVYRPYPGTISYAQLRKTSLNIKDLFFHEQFIPGFEGQWNLFNNKSFISDLMNLINLKKVYKSLFGKFSVEKNFYRNRYNAIKTMILSTSFRKIVDFIIKIGPFGNADKKQKIIVSRYTNDNFINNLSKN